jgi:hypothetical protein
MHRSKLHFSSAVVLLTLCSAAAEITRAADRLSFEVREETAGIRRRNDVITARLPAESDVGDAQQFRLLRMGEPLPAQFRRVERPDGSSEWVVDFIDHFTPFESRGYAVARLQLEGRRLRRGRLGRAVLCLSRRRQPAAC